MDQKNKKQQRPIIPLKTNLVMQQAFIEAGLLDQKRADRINIILKEEKRKARQRRRAAQARRAAAAHERWNRAA